MSRRAARRQRKAQKHHAVPIQSRLELIRSIYAKCDALQRAQSDLVAPWALGVSTVVVPSAAYILLQQLIAWGLYTPITSDQVASALYDGTFGAEYAVEKAAFESEFDALIKAIEQVLPSMTLFFGLMGSVHSPESATDALSVMPGHPNRNDPLIHFAEQCDRTRDYFDL